jgi:hypothetical protein
MRPKKVLREARRHLGYMLDPRLLKTRRKRLRSDDGGIPVGRQGLEVVSMQKVVVPL